MSAFGPKQTWAVALHMSAFGGKADIVANQTTTAGGFSGILKVDLSEIASKFVLQEGPARLPHTL
jgi:hypothetical protein